MNDDPGWHLDRKVPIGIIIAIVVQTATFFIWASSWTTRMDMRVGYLEANDTTQSLRIQKVEEINSKVAVMESQQSNILRRIDIQTTTMQEILNIVSKLAKN